MTDSDHTPKFIPARRPPARLGEEDELAAGRVMVTAALSAFGERLHQEMDQEAIAILTVRALAAANAARDSEQDRLSDAMGASLRLDIEPSDAAATAFWLWSENDGFDASAAHARSVAGVRMLGFAQGLAAAKKMADALDSFDDMVSGGSELSFARAELGADCLMTLLEKDKS